MFPKSLKIFLFSAFLTATYSLFAQNTPFTIEGEIFFNDSGTIHIYLVTEKIFKKPFTSLQELVLEIGPVGINEVKIPFRFEGIKSGTYDIRCFQDVNGNGKLDRGFLRPSEP
jgi:uncharacterized protein (DUF2141 family)